MCTSVSPPGRVEAADVAPTPLLWADCDTPAAVAAATAFDPAPTMIVTTGSGTGTGTGTHRNIHAYWALTRCLSIEMLEDSNRRLAAALGADSKCADATRILRVPETLNFKDLPPRPVGLQEHSGARYLPAEILTARPRPQDFLPASQRGQSELPRLRHAREGLGLLRLPDPERETTWRGHLHARVAAVGHTHQRPALLRAASSPRSAIRSPPCLSRLSTSSP